MSPAGGRSAVVVLISGRGSNLQSILDGVRDGTLPVEVRAVISNRPGAAGLERARGRGVPALTVDHRAHPDAASFEAALRERIDGHAPDLVVLAGFMRILGAQFVEHYRGRMINIHPSLLPRFRGLDTHRRALDAGVTEHGASVHFVTPEVDGGPVIAQARVPVFPGDDAAGLADRVLAQEHRLYPLVIGWFAQGRIRLDGSRVLMDGQALTEPRCLEATPEEEPRHGAP